MKKKSTPLILKYWLIYNYIFVHRVFIIDHVKLKVTLLRVKRKKSSKVATCYLLRNNFFSCIRFDFIIYILAKYEYFFSFQLSTTLGNTWSINRFFLSNLFNSIRYQYFWREKKPLDNCSITREYHIILCSENKTLTSEFLSQRNEIDDIVSLYFEYPKVKCLSRRPWKRRTPLSIRFSSAHVIKLS